MAGSSSATWDARSKSLSRSEQHRSMKHDAGTFHSERPRVAFAPYRLRLRFVKRHVGLMLQRPPQRPRILEEHDHVALVIIELQPSLP